MSERQTGVHPRNIGPISASPRCGATTRKGAACRALAVGGERGYRIDGGAVGSGAPKGNKNALVSGLHTGDMIARRRRLGELVRESRAILRKMSGDYGRRIRRFERHPDALKIGLCTREMIAMRREIARFMRGAWVTLERIAED